MEMSTTCGFDTIWLHNSIPRSYEPPPTLWPQLCGVSLHPPSPWFPGVQARMAEMQSRWEERFCEAVDFWHQAWSTTTSVAPMASWGSGGSMVRIAPSVDDLFPGALPNGTNRIWSFAIKIMPHNIHHNAGLRFTHVYSHPGLTLTPSWNLSRWVGQDDIVPWNFVVAPLRPYVGYQII